MRQMIAFCVQNECEWMLFRMKKIVLVNDTSLYSTHFGCQLVGQVYREQFKRVGLDLVLSLPKVFDSKRWDAVIRGVDLVVINGEGSIHHGRNLHLLDLADKYPVALMNCVYEENPRMDVLNNMIYVTARESLSAAEIGKVRAQCEVVPDMIFASSMVRAFPVSSPSLEICITDSVIKTYKGFGPFKRKDRGDLAAHGLTPAQYLAQLTSYKRVCAGRFHAAVVASILGVPFSAWDSNTWKTRGMLEDMGVPHLHFEKRHDALRGIPQEFDARIRTYADNAKIKVESAFDRLRSLVG